MGLTTKFNLILIPVLGLGFFVVGLVMRGALLDNARNEVIEQAGLMMESATAVRAYTVDEIRPLLAMQIKRAFLPQTVPAYAATQSFLKLHDTNPDYTYKEATLNPTNPRDRAVDWEADIISMFENNAELTEFIGRRETPAGNSLYLARPIRITNENCLTCHSTPGAAPGTMIDRYGSTNGFGWKMQEVVGAQIVSVPMQIPVAKAEGTFRQLMIVLAVVFLAVLVLANLLLRAVVLRPMKSIARIANDVSHGKLDVPEFDIRGKDELAVLSASFNRMRRSLDKAFRLLDEQG